MEKRTETTFDTFTAKQFSKEMKRLDYKKKDLLTDIWRFRYACYKLNYFMKHIALPNIKTKSYYEAVFIEFRILPHIEFILRNAILKLGNSWSFTVVCGYDNHVYMTDLCGAIHPKIKIICMPHNNITQEQYSTLLTTKDFWQMFYGEKILIYQEDSLLFKSGIAPFLNYDFIGAPFHKMANDTPNGVGNGGFSLRTKCKMLEVIDSCRVEDVQINSTTLAYMDMVGLKTIPEDVYFSKTMQEKHIGEVANWDSAHEFSSEQVFNPNSLGGHKFWIANKHWKDFLKNLFGFSLYRPRTDLNKYLIYKNLGTWLNKNHQIANAFDIDNYFFCRANNIEYKSDLIVLEYIKNIGLDGFIYHPKQLFNIFPDAKLYRFLDNIYVYHRRQVLTIQEFANKYLYNSTFDYLCDELLKKKYDTINDNYDTYLLVFLGNETVAIDLLKRIIKYKTLKADFNIAFCINTSSIKDKTEIKQLVRDNFDFYAIYYSKEFGTDITPTILMYNDIIKTHNIKHIIKLHTKTITDMYDNLTNFLLDRPFEELMKEKQDNCNCIGPPDLYRPLYHDSFNRQLQEKYSDQIHGTHSFVMGTIFYTENATFQRVLGFIKNNNYRPYLFNNLYENNSINQEFSPIHFLERLFGVIRL